MKTVLLVILLIFLALILRFVFTSTTPRTSGGTGTRPEVASQGIPFSKWRIVEGYPSREHPQGNRAALNGCISLGLMLPNDAPNVTAVEEQRRATQLRDGNAALVTMTDSANGGGVMVFEAYRCP